MWSVCAGVCGVRVGVCGMRVRVCARGYHSQSLLLCDVEGGGHVHEGGQTVQVMAVTVREDGVGLRKTTHTHHDPADSMGTA